MTATPIVIKISNRDDFRKFATPFGINIGERGRLPVEKFVVAIAPGLADGTIKITDTPFFSLANVLSGSKSGGASAEISYTITYKVLNTKTGKPMPGDKTLTVTTNEVKGYLPHLNVRGALGLSTALMVVAIAKAKDGALLTDLQKYVIEKVEKVAETTNESPESEDTNGDDTDAVHASEVEINAAMDAGEQVAEQTEDSELATVA